MAESRKVGDLEKVRAARKIMMSVLENYPKVKREAESGNYNRDYWIRSEVKRTIDTLFSIESDIHYEETYLKCEEIKKEREEFNNLERDPE